MEEEEKMHRFISAPLFWCITAEIIGGWASWHWYASRIATDPDEFYGLLALIAAVIIAIMAKPTAKLPRYSFLLLTFLMLYYAANYHTLFPLARAVLLMTALASTISIFRFGCYLQPGICGLFYLSLPVISSLQFYLGFPMRSLVANIDKLLLGFAGISVTVEGTALRWGNDLIVVDAPCSGVKMLWTGIFIACVMITYFRFGWYKSILSIIGTVVLVILGNALRASALFYPEAGILKLPPMWHDGTGIIVFIFTAIAICWYIKWLHRRETCAK
jgi:exosortase/archaeosortase family protein